MSESQRYDLVAFDLDGTLVETVADIADALNVALAEVGRARLSDGEVVKLVGSGARELVRRALGGEAGESDRVLARFLEAYAERPCVRSSLYLGVKETLAKIDAAKAIATNKPGAIARAVVEKLGIAGAFACVLGEDDVGRRKPDPLIVEIARGKVGAARARTLYVGDSRTDADTAQAAGVDCALVTYGYEAPDVLARLPARHRIDRFADLLSIVRA